MAPPLPLTSAGQTSATSEKSVPPVTIDVTLKYMLLAPSESFKDVAEEAKAVILAGGTMSPVESPTFYPSNITADVFLSKKKMSDFREQLFPYLPPERFSTFSCGHIVPPDRVKTIAVGVGPSGMKLNFTFEKRKDEKLVSAPIASISSFSLV